MRTIYWHQPRDWSSYFEALDYEQLLKTNENYDLLRYLESHLPDNGLILEGGCGPGRLAIHLARKGYRMVGLEKTKDLLFKARGYDPTPPLTCGDVFSLPFKDGAFGAYISGGVIEHFEDYPLAQLAILKEARRVLKPDGLLMATVPIWAPFRRFNRLLNLRENLKSISLVRRAFGKKPLTRFFESYLFTREEFRGLVEEAGFRVELLEPICHVSGIMWHGARYFRRYGTIEAPPGVINTPGQLNRTGRMIYRLFRRRYPWFFPQSALIVARRG